jgi:hypothetical protein
MKKTLYACEAVWSESNGVLAEWSMQPFFQGLAMLHGFRFLYRTFTSGTELKGLLGLEFPAGTSSSKIAYIGAHGYGGRLSSGYGGRGINLKPIAESACRDIEGVWVSACYVGGADSLRQFLIEGGAVWAGGYSCEISWESAMLIDLAIINTVMSSQPATSKEEAVALFAQALCSFDPDWQMGSRDGVAVRLRDAIRLEARTQVQGSRAEDVTEQLLEKLGWEDVAERASA